MVLLLRRFVFVLSQQRHWLGRSQVGAGPAQSNCCRNSSKILANFLVFPDFEFAGFAYGFAFAALRILFVAAAALAGPGPGRGWAGAK